eukprot:1736013-Pyramimonas_sp.AAC.2
MEGAPPGRSRCDVNIRKTVEAISAEAPRKLKASWVETVEETSKTVLEVRIGVTLLPRALLAGAGCVS